MPTRVALSACLILSLVSSSLLAQDQFYLAPGSFMHLGLDSLEITSLAVDRTNAGALFAGTRGHGVYAIFPFGTDNVWHPVGLSGKTITALNVQHQGGGPIEGFTLQAAALSGNDSTTREFTCNTFFKTGWAFPVDTSWRMVANDSIRKTLRAVRVISAGDYHGHDRPLPVYIGGTHGLSLLGDDSALAGNRVVLDSVEVNAIAGSWLASPGLLLAAGSLRGHPVAYKSTDGGLTWSQTISLDFAGTSWNSLAFKSSLRSDTVYAASDGGSYLSFDGGARWQWIGGGLNPVRALLVDPLHSERLFVYRIGQKGFYYSRDGGANWLTDVGGDSLGEVTAMVIVYPSSADSLPYVFLGTKAAGVWAYRASDGRAHLAKPFTFPLAIGDSWRYSHELRETVVGDTLMTDGKRYFVVLVQDEHSSSYSFRRLSGDSVMFYTNQPVLQYDLGRELGVTRNGLFGVGRTTVAITQETILGRSLREWRNERTDPADGETNWIAYVADSLGVVFRLTFASGEYWQLKGAIIDGVRYGTISSVGEASQGAATPKEFRLEQNYPNPFNPTTTISYALPVRSHVDLAVFDLLGRRVAQLVNGDIAAGVHEVSFNAAQLASGVYFYRIQAGAYLQTKTMLLVR